VGLPDRTVPNPVLVASAMNVIVSILLSLRILVPAAKC